MLHLKPKECKDILHLTPNFQFGEITYTFDADMDDLDHEKAKNELRETPENVANAIAELRKLLEGEPDLIVPDSEEFYTVFCRRCKWYPESAFALIKRCYKFRISYQDALGNLVPSTLRDVFRSNLMMALPVRTNDGCRVVLFNCGKYWKPKEISLSDYFRATIVALDFVCAEPKTQVAGVHVILNMDGLSFSQVTYFTPSFAFMVVDFVQNCLPSRLKGIHIVNESFIFNLVFAIFKPFIQEKFRKRVHFHGRRLDSITKYINRESLPDLVGGMVDTQMDSDIGEKIIDKLCLFEKSFEEAKSFGYVKQLKKQNKK